MLIFTRGMTKCYGGRRKLDRKLGWNAERCRRHRTPDIRQDSGVCTGAKTLNIGRATEECWTEQKGENPVYRTGCMALIDTDCKTLQRTLSSAKDAGRYKGPGTLPSMLNIRDFDQDAEPCGR